MRQILKDEQDKFSSKRVVTFLLSITMVIVVVANVFFGCTIDDYVFDGLVTAFICSIGVVGTEQFAGAMRKRNNPETKLPTRPGGEEVEQF